MAMTSCGAGPQAPTINNSTPLLEEVPHLQEWRQGECIASKGGEPWGITPTNERTKQRRTLLWKLYLFYLLLDLENYQKKEQLWEKELA